MYVHFDKIINFSVLKSFSKAGMFTVKKNRLFPYRILQGLNRLIAVKTKSYHKNTGEWAFSELPFTSVSKRVLVLNLSSEFYSQIHSNANSKTFSCEWLCTRTRSEKQRKKVLTQKIATCENHNKNRFPIRKCKEHPTTVFSQML